MAAVQREAQARGAQLQLSGLPAGLASLATVYGVAPLLDLDEEKSLLAERLRLEKQWRSGDVASIDNYATVPARATPAMWTGEFRGRLSHEQRRPTWNHFKAGDGKWFMIGALPR